MIVGIFDYLLSVPSVDADNLCHIKKIAHAVNRLQFVERGEFRRYYHAKHWR